MSNSLEASLMTPAGAWAATLTTPLSLLLLGLVLLNITALLRPGSLLSRAVAAALLLPLLLLLALPLAGWSREPLLQASIPLLVLLILAALLRSGQAHPPQLTPASAAATGRRTTQTDRHSYTAAAVAASLVIGLLLALRPHPFEYPGDSTDYLQTFIQAQLQEAPTRSCLVEGVRQPTYQRFCTLWGVILESGHLQPGVLLSGIPQRFTLALEVLVLGLSCFRLLQGAAVGTAAATLSWLLVAFGLGNQSISFLVNHGLQGSILAAAVFVEAVMVLLRLLQWRTQPARQAGGVIAALLLFLLLEMKLHGAFALCTLVLLVPLPALIGAARLAGRLKQPRAWAALSPAAARWLLIASLGLLVLVLSLKTGWLLNKQARFIVPWSFLGGLGLPPHALPGSYLMRAPGSRPESLALAGMLIGIVHLARSWRPGGRDSSGPGQQGLDGGDAAEASSEAALYQLVASLYGLAVLVAFLLPPFSHLFLNLPYEVTSNYRLMWGCILFSPLPCLLQQGLAGSPPPLAAAGGGGGRGRRRILPAVVTLLVTAVVLIPLPGGSKRSPQLLWSKSRHILVGPPARVDLGATAAALLPALVRAAPRGDGDPPVVLADELIASALAPWTPLLRPTHPIRVYNRADLSDRRLWDTQAPLRAAPSSAVRVRLLLDLESQPTLAVQQGRFDADSAYSPYSEIGVYDHDIVTQVSATSVNALSSAELEAAGFRLWQRLDGRGTPLPATAPRQAEVYRIWRRAGTPP